MVQLGASKRWLKLAMIVVMTALAGCGGSSSSTTSGAAQTRFEAHADAICARADKQAEALEGGMKRLETTSLERAVTLLNRTAAELSALRPPAQSEAGFRRFLALARDEIALVVVLTRAVRAHDTAAAQDTASKLNSNASNEAARRIGLNVCARER